MERMMGYKQLGVVIPADFDQTLASGGEPTLTGYVLWVHRARAAELEVKYSNKFTELLGQPVRVKIGENFVIPAPDVETSGVHFHILFATLFVTITLVPALMMEEKRTKTLDALLVSPASAGQVVMGKALAGLFYVLLGGGLFFALHWAYVTNWGLALVAFLGCAMFSIGLALAMGSFIQSRQHMVIWMLPVMFVLIIPAYFSQEPNLAPGLKAVFSWLPTSALVRIFQFSLSSSAPVDQLLTNLAVALGGIVLVFAAVTWKVRQADR
jgi:ABC-2 type transport system permease protein